MPDLPAFLAAGAALGASAGFSPGPLLTLVLAQTLAHGPREGVKVAMAPCSRTPPCSWPPFWPCPSFRTGPPPGPSVPGRAAVVTLYGLECLRARPLSLPDIRVSPGSLRKGVVANFLNPHPYVFWATVGAPATCPRPAPRAASGRGRVFVRLLPVPGRGQGLRRAFDRKIPLLPGQPGLRPAHAPSRTGPFRLRRPLRPRRPALPRPFFLIPRTVVLSALSYARNDHMLACRQHLAKEAS